MKLKSFSKVLGLITFIINHSFYFFFSFHIECVFWTICILENTKSKVKIKNGYYEAQFKIVHKSKATTYQFWYNIEIPYVWPNSAYIHTIAIMGHLSSTYAKFFEKLRVRIRGLKILFLLKILCTYLMDDSLIPIVSLKRVGLSAFNKPSRVNQELIIVSYCTH